jgi:hypothetical protein
LWCLVGGSDSLSIHHKSSLLEESSLLVSGFESLRFWRCDFACNFFPLFLVPLLAIRWAWSALLREGTAPKACLFVFGVWGFVLGLG